MEPIIIKSVLKLLMCIVVLITFYIFIMTIMLKSKDYKDIFSTWQFPMLLAIFLDILIEPL